MVHLFAKQPEFAFEYTENRLDRTLIQERLLLHHLLQYKSANVSSSLSSSVLLNNGTSGMLRCGVALLFFSPNVALLRSGT